MNRGDATILFEVIKKVRGNDNLPRSTTNKTLFKLLVIGTKTTESATS
jgi:hypothetical protein